MLGSTNDLDPHRTTQNQATWPHGRPWPPAEGDGATTVLPGQDRPQDRPAWLGEPGGDDRPDGPGTGGEPPLPPAGQGTGWRPRRPSGWRRGAAAFVAAVTIAAGGGVAGALIAGREQPASAVGPVVVSTAPSNSAAGDVEQAAQALLPEVVEIDVQTPQGAGTGSGVIMRSDGYILTNAHVAGDATAITVVLSTGERLTGRLVGADTNSDIAVVKVDRTNLPAATFATSGEVKVGQSVVAVGSPFGLSGSVTTGIVSALNRVVTGAGDGGGQIVGAIQTDAAINPGNSGGALADEAAHVIGINTAIATNGTDANAGVGFAIPATQALGVAEKLIAGQPVETPYLGVSGSEQITDQLAKQFGLGNRSGALVQQVAPGGPADRAGIRQGDLVVKLNGADVRNWDQLVVASRGTTVGKAVQVVVVRDGKELTLDLTPAARPAG
jgi:S1-C subfamily serine protease